ncbi:uncharacterized protein METZ01_LOCUS224931, partial [marine metagenome]
MQPPLNISGHKKNCFFNSGFSVAYLQKSINLLREF